jgi:hypothetical protein
MGLTFFWVVISYVWFKVELGVESILGEEWLDSGSFGDIFVIMA